MKTLLQVDDLVNKHTSISHLLKNTKLVKSRRDGSMVYHHGINGHFNCFQNSHWENLIYVESEEIEANTDLVVGNLYLVNWGTNISGEKLYELSRLSKIGAAGIHYFDDMAMTFGSHEIKSIAFNVTKTSNDDLRHLGTGEYIPGFSEEEMQKLCEDMNLKLKLNQLGNFHKDRAERAKM